MKTSKQKRRKARSAGLRFVTALDLGAHLLDEGVVPDAGRAGRHAGHAAEAAVDVRGDRARGRRRSRAASRMRTMRPRGESISSPQTTYVGQVGRQKPQWMQVLIEFRIHSDN